MACNRPWNVQQWPLHSLQQDCYGMVPFSCGTAFLGTLEVQATPPPMLLSPDLTSLLLEFGLCGAARDINSAQILLLEAGSEKVPICILHAFLVTLHRALV